jgi:hypothetical protein
MLWEGYCMRSIHFQRKRRSIFAREERDNTKIKLLSPRCIATIPQQRLLPETLLSTEADAAWSGEPPPPVHDGMVG